MNGSTENRASEASERPSGTETIMTWAAASRMLPLVRHIVADILESQTRLAHSFLEKDNLDRQRRNLAWPDRFRRYQLQEEISSRQQHLNQAIGELEALGVQVLERETGQVGFPTVVNKRRAFFSWTPGEQTLAFWQYLGDPERRSIPSGWTQAEARKTRKR